MTIKTYSELVRLETLEERFKYLSLKGKVGETTFGFDRYMNQMFYTSTAWRQLRHHVMARDNCCDLGVADYEIHGAPVIHHLIPLSPAGIMAGDTSMLDPEFLITTSLKTHNAIHFGDAELLPKAYVPRRFGDTKLW